MRPFSAILLVCLFTLGQFARHLSYLECTLANTLKYAPQKCDCEKKAGFEQSGNDPSSQPKAHQPLHAEDYFSGLFENPVCNPGEMLRITFYLQNCNDKEDGNRPGHWQPPNLNIS